MTVKEFDINELDAWAPAVELTWDLLKTIKAFKAPDSATMADLMVAIFLMARYIIAAAAEEGAMSDNIAKLDELLESVVSSIVAGRCPELIEVEQSTIQ